MSKALFTGGRLPRRVITTTHEGKSRVASDGPAPHAINHQATPGMLSSVLYRTAVAASTPEEIIETAPAGGILLPEPGETVLLMVQFPPDSVYADPGFDPAAAGQEQVDFAADFAARFEPDAPGFHTTASIDYGVVVDGQVVLELDEQKVQLSQGDVVVQNSTRHAWRNPYEDAAVMAFVLIGATTTS